MSKGLVLESESERVSVYSHVVTPEPSALPQGTTKRGGKEVQMVLRVSCFSVVIMSFIL